MKNKVDKVENGKVTMTLPLISSGNSVMLCVTEGIKPLGLIRGDRVKVTMERAEEMKATEKEGRKVLSPDQVAALSLIKKIESMWNVVRVTDLCNSECEARGIFISCLERADSKAVKAGFPSPNVGEIQFFTSDYIGGEQAYWGNIENLKEVKKRFRAFFEGIEAEYGKIDLEKEGKE